MAVVLLLHLQQPGQLGLDRRNLLLGGEAVVAEGGDPGILLGLQGGHPHHEELIEVVAEDGAELGLLQQRGVFVEGLGQHPVVEGNPTQLPVDVERGIDHGCSGRCRHGGRVGMGHRAERSNLKGWSWVLAVLDRVVHRRPGTPRPPAG